MKRQMLFIEPTAAQVHIFSQFTPPRPGSFILAGLANRRSTWSTRVFIEGQRHFDLDAWIADLYVLPVRRLRRQTDRRRDAPARRHPTVAGSETANLTGAYERNL